MTHQEIKYKMRSKRSLLLTGRDNNQAGVSLLLSLLILAGIAAISFSLASIIFIEIKASGDVPRTETALYASYAITEEALFKTEREAPVNYITSLNNVTMESTEALEASSPFVDTVLPTETNQYDFVDAADPQAGAGYGGAKVVYSSTTTDTLHIDLYEINPNPPPGQSGKTLIDSADLASFSAFWQKLDLDINLQYQLDVKNTSSTNSISVNIYSYSDSGTTLKGLPNVGQTVVDIIAQYLGLTRKYHVIIPK